MESLVGTVFEMRLSGGETVGNIKLRLQRLEGIPRQHMHLRAGWKTVTGIVVHGRGGPQIS